MGLQHRVRMEEENYSHRKTPSDLVHTPSLVTRQGHQKNRFL